MPKSLSCVLFGLVVLAHSHAVSAGTISGKVTNPDQCTGVQVLKREGDHPLKPKVINAAYDPKTGKFRSPDLAEGSYDLRLLIRDGVLEGVDMSVPPPEEGDRKPLIARDIVDISKVVTKPVSTYIDIHRLITVRGHADRARGLVEAIRHRKAHARPAGEITWGIEVWYFENWTGAWVRPPASRGRRKVLRRLRVPADMPKADFERRVCLFDPDLGGLKVGPNTSVKGLSVTVPKPAIALGKVAGSVRKQVEEDKKAKPDRFDR